MVVLVLMLEIVMDNFDNFLVSGIIFKRIDGVGYLFISLRLI